MRVFDNYAIGVDLPLLSKMGVSVDDFKVASGQVDGMVEQAGRVATDATFGKAINLRKSYLSHSGRIGSCVVQHILNHMLGKDRVTVIFNPNKDYPTKADRTLDFFSAIRAPLIVHAGDPKDLGYLVRFEGTRKARGCCKDNGGDCQCGDQCQGQDDGSPCCGSCNPEDDLPAVRLLSGWTEAQVWATVHRLGVCYPLDYLKDLLPTP